MPDYKKIELENQKLQSTVDVLLKKLIKQENNFKETLANSMAWGALQEQRAAQAVSRLEAINNSFSWRVISKINNKLDKFPRLRLSIKRGVKLLIWTAKGQLPSKLREFREAQKAQAAGNGIDFTAIEKVGSTAFCIEHTTLPSTLLDRILFL